MGGFRSFRTPRWAPEREFSVSAFSARAHSTRALRPCALSAHALTYHTNSDARGFDASIFSSTSARWAAPVSDRSRQAKQHCHTSGESSHQRLQRGRLRHRDAAATDAAAHLRTESRLANWRAHRQQLHISRDPGCQDNHHTKRSTAFTHISREASHSHHMKARRH